jgi:enoyl-CoA hydratase
VPYFLAAGWALTGDHVRAADAKAAGLMNRLVPPGEPLADAVQPAARIARNGRWPSPRPIAC